MKIEEAKELIAHLRIESKDPNCGRTLVVEPDFIVGRWLRFYQLRFGRMVYSREARRKSVSDNYSFGVKTADVI